MRTFHLLSGSLILVVSIAWVNPSSLNGDQIETLIEELNSAEFDVRDQATQALIDAGPAVVEPLRKRLENASLEVTARGVFVLQELARRNMIVGVDLVEVAPEYDQTGSTAILAAQVLLNFLGFIFHYRQ